MRCAVPPKAKKERGDLLELKSRPLRDDEWVAVTWVLDEPGDAAIARNIDRRRHRLLRLLDEAKDQGAVPTVDDLAGALDVGQATVRRDLDALRKQGYRVLTRGSRRPRRPPAARNCSMS